MSFKDCLLREFKEGLAPDSLLWLLDLADFLKSLELLALYYSFLIFELLKKFI
jgi:hypothetical protein